MSAAPHDRTCAAEAANVGFVPLADILLDLSRAI
jgi:hypothetical protein